MEHTSGVSGIMEPYREVTKERSGCKLPYQQRIDLGSWKMIPRKSRMECPRNFDLFLAPHGALSGQL